MAEITILIDSLLLFEWELAISMCHINASIDTINIPTIPISESIPITSEASIVCHLLYASGFSDVAIYSTCRMPRAAENGQMAKTAAATMNANRAAPAIEKSF